ncbi:Translation factor GUF1, mitochondrial [Araneus ventricosus]|uniref:Translation factor GUF1, mitochondrial n=1 Tax=Araneus ventricosus TaxID=182803 RepID=A0A4Y2EUY5_ARAVE|nr:Translation factor GUF1, mitochondrial [Araneus ventricosus]
MVHSRIFYNSRLKFSSERKEFKVNMKNFPLENIRNFGIIAHVDHGKSTLSDRLMNLAGHVDFSYEVNRSLVACQGVILLVDANQGVQAQTVANFNLASSHNLEIIPVLNKIDLKNAKPEIVSNQLASLFGFNEKDILQVSAKLGTGIEDVLHSVIEKIPPPHGDINQQFRALQYDSWYSQYQGVICLILVVDGSIQVGDEITSSSSGFSYVVKELDLLLREKGMKEIKKTRTLKNNENQIEINYFFPNLKRTASTGVRHSGVHLCLSTSDSHSVKEAADTVATGK